MPVVEAVMKSQLNVRIQNISLAYQQKIIYSNLNLDLPAGKWVALLGPSGIGKSSLLRRVAGLSHPKEKVAGKIETDNDIPVHQQIAYMAQTDLLLPWFNALENATLGLKLRAHTHKAQQIDRAISLFEQVGLAHAMHLYPQELSGGMRQRVALVRTLMEDKPIVLMDEPFSALDATTRYKLQELALQLLQDKTVLFITHDPFEALRLADILYLMRGNPATLKPLFNLNSNSPRDLTHPEMLILQTQLFQELNQLGDA